MADWFEAILAPGQRVEVRAFGDRGSVGSAVFDRADLAGMIAKAQEFERQANVSVYFGLGDVAEEVEKNAKDHQVKRRTLLMIDADPERAEGFRGQPATDEEKARAFAVILTIRDYLRGQGWPEPVLADSGNGYHLLYRIDLLNDCSYGLGKIDASKPDDPPPTVKLAEGESIALVKKCLAAINAKFGTAEVLIDPAVCNASRVCKLYGTEARKGVESEGRPWRRSGVIEMPERPELVPVPREMLESLAALAPAKKAGLSDRLKDELRAAKRQVAGGKGGASKERRALAYVAATPGAISGQHGHNQMFKICCAVYIGFDLDFETAFQYFASVYNDKCDPPWALREIEHKLAEADKVETRPRGWKLAERGRGGLDPERLDAIGRRAVEVAKAARNNPAAVIEDDQLIDDLIAVGEADPATLEGITLRMKEAGGRKFPAAPLKRKLKQRRQEGSGTGDDSDAEPDIHRPVILVTTETHEVVKLAIEAIADDPNLYQRGHQLASILRTPMKSKRPDVARPLGTPRITPMQLATILGFMTRNALWVRDKELPNGETVQAPVVPPDWAVKGVAADGEWRGVRLLEAIVETPTLRPDGEVIDEPGYDSESGLFYEPNGVYPPIPKRPTKSDAQAAAKKLLGVVSDFPFKDDAHRVVWLAGLLTPLARFAIDGPCPLFLIDANTPGTGKSKLADVIAIIVTGRGMPRTAYPDSDEEMRKRIASIALAGDRLMLLDNVATTFGGSSLDSALTAITWKDRNLGKMEMTAELPLNTVWYATGNNVSLRGDAIRRVQLCRLEAAEEKPEERQGFAIPDLLAHVMEHRGELVAAALTLLRAHAVAGRPRAGLVPLGSFESWSDIVRAAVNWATGIDPCETRKDLAEADDEQADRGALIEGWAELSEGTTGTTAAKAIQFLADPVNANAATTLRDAVTAGLKNGAYPSARSLGMKLKAIKGRVIGGRKIVCEGDDNHTKVWKVVDVRVNSKTGTKGTKGTNPHTPRKKLEIFTPCEDAQKKPFLGSGDGDRSPQSPQSPSGDVKRGGRKRGEL